MAGYGRPVSDLTVEESWIRLRSRILGRIVTRVGDAVDIVPINYVVDGETLVFRTAEGTKLSALAINPQVLLEIDHFDDDEGWSVVVRGQARHVTSTEEIAACDELPLEPMVPTLKHHYVRIEPQQITGRIFARATEPNREADQPG